MTATPAPPQACASSPPSLATRALLTQLEHLRQLYHLRCLVLCDSSGHTLASAGFAEEAALLAAHLTTCAPLNTPELRVDLLATRAMFLNGERLMLGVVGAACAPDPDSLSRAISCVRRLSRAHQPS